MLLPLTASAAEPYCWATVPAVADVSEQLPAVITGPESEPPEDPEEDPLDEPESDAELSAPDELPPLLPPPLLLVLPLLDADPPPELDADPESIPSAPVPSPCSPGTVVQAMPASQRANGAPPQMDLLKRFATLDWSAPGARPAQQSAAGWPRASPFESRRRPLQRLPFPW